MGRTPAGAEGFDDLFRAEYPGLVQRVQLVVGSTALAEEIVQDTFCGALERWGRVRHVDRPGAWVQVALRRAIKVEVDDGGERAGARVVGGFRCRPGRHRPPARHRQNCPRASGARWCSTTWPTSRSMTWPRCSACRPGP
ncbi:MAG: sigma factor [Acidimicrobiales bacterium]